MRLARYAKGIIFVMSALSLVGIGVTVAVIAESGGHGHGEGEHDEDEEKGEHKEHGDEHKDVEHGLSITPEQAAKLSLPVVTAGPGPIDQTIAMLGRILLNPDRSQHVHARYPGVVREVYKGTGDSVRVGDTLARVENNVGQVYELTAAIDGTVMERRIAEGQSVDETLEAFRVADIRDVLVSLIAYSRDVKALKKGMRVYVEDQDGHSTHSGEIRYVSPVLDSHTRTAQAQFLVANTEGHLRPGQYVIGHVIIGQQDAAVRLPVTAVGRIDDDRKIKLLTKVREAFVVKDVTLGRRDSQFVEIVAGLEAGAEVIGAPFSQVERLVEDQEGEDAE